ncbi:hypothetical protein GGQ92_000376 [Gracilibacillus halotolerans]|uniref:Uncharacterized protein n=1 Tax=Gracilibacillus halotolerans TaxID=74386 RepID=A0A841RGK9_9BACI|nr:DUF6123 family protein [Gracilibacillus halotolerans]MBB6511609.1 hypothetical protein [Gracilibacillus halotolerans]
MNESELLAHFLEDLWAKGFKLTDEEVSFIYFCQKYTNASASHAMFALSQTLRLQMAFDRGFYISLLELFVKANVQSNREVVSILKQNGLLSD